MFIFEKEKSDCYCAADARIKLIGLICLFLLVVLVVK